MKLSDLLKPKKSISDAYASGGFFSTQPAEGTMLQQSINKSSPSFKATTTTQSGEPIAKPSTPAAARTDLQGVDYYTNLYQNASKPETKAAALDWLSRNAVDYGTDTVMDESVTDTMQSDGMVEDTSGIDFSTPTSNVAYGMEKLNEIYGTKSPEDLWALRDTLRRKSMLASVGMLPEEEYMGFSGEGVTDGKPRYNYQQRMAVNDATADIFGNRVADIDKFMDDFSKGESAKASGGSSITGTFNGMDAGAIIRMATQGMSGTADERAAIQQDLANALATGDSAMFLDGLKSVGFVKMPQAQQEQLIALGQNIPILDQAIGLIQANPKALTGNIGSMKEELLKNFNKQDPEYSALVFLLESVNAPIRNKIFGASLTEGEAGAANKFLIDTKKDTGAIVIQKARALQATQTMNIDRQQLMRSGVNTLSKIKQLEESGAIPSYYDYLKQFGVDDKLIPENIKPKQSSSSSTQPASSWNQNPDGTWSFKKVGSGTNKAPKVVAGYDISSYATDPQHEAKVAKIYQSTPPFRTPQEIDMVIRKVAPKSRITGQMVATAANTYGVDPKMVYAMMLQDSSLGTAGMGARNNNPGNIGQFDNLSSPVKGYATLQDGVNAVAKWLSRKKVTQNNYA